MACCSTEAGTVWGVRPAEAGKAKAPTAPLTASITASCQICAWPESSSVAASPWVIAPSALETTITRVREKRSATTPPKSMSRTCGMVRQAITRPSAATEPERSSTAKARAMGATALPRKEAKRPKKSCRNAWKRSGAKVSRWVGAVVT